MKTESADAHEVAKFRSLAREAAKFYFGGFPKRIVYRSSGLSNFVFTFNNADGDFVIRISPDPSRINLFIKEQWAETAAKEVGVPTPSILEVGFELIQYPYMISRVVSGEEATHHPKRLEILRDLGKNAAAINSIRTRGFGQTFDWSENKLSLNSSFKSYLYDEFCFEGKIETLRKNKMVSPKTSKELTKIFSAAASKKPKATLSHGDLRLKNVIASEDGRINAILDWETCTSNFAPAWELSLALHDLGIDEVHAFLGGYGLSDAKLLDALPLMKAFNIANYARAVEEAASAGNKKLLSHYRLRLNGSLDLYSL